MAMTRCRSGQQKWGLWDSLTKPVREQDLLDAIRVTLDHGRIRLNQAEALSSLRHRYASLSSRNVMALVTSVKVNK
jgi:FixJ family two-component response regulator